MTFRKTTIYAAVLVAFAVLGASADTIQSTTSGAAFQTGWHAADNTTSGQAYFDNPSFDGKKKNLGFCIAGGGNCVVPGQPGTPLPAWGVKNGSGFIAADPSFWFAPTSGGSTVSLVLELAGWAPSNVFGWYSKDNPSALHPLLQNCHPSPTTGDCTVTQTATFSPHGAYGFYLNDGGKGIYFYTQSQFNLGLEDGLQHFAVFNDPTGAQGSYWIGVEDQGLNSRQHGDKDFQDMLIHMTPILTPEPASLALLGSGLVGLAAIVRRKSRG